MKKGMAEKQKAMMVPQKIRKEVIREMNSSFSRVDQDLDRQLSDRSLALTSKTMQTINPKTHKIERNTKSVNISFESRRMTLQPRVQSNHVRNHSFKPH